MYQYSQLEPDKNQSSTVPKHKTLFHVVVAFFVLSTFGIVVHGQNGSETLNSANKARQQSAIQSGGEETDAALATVASGTGLLVVLSVLMIGLLVTRRVRGPSGSEMVSQDGNDSNGTEVFGSNRDRIDSRSTNNNREVSFNRTLMEPAARQSPPPPSSPYSAYRIDQEVRKRVLGFAYGAEVFASRGPEERRAIETSLLRSVTFSDSDDERRRAREALEQHGFVARYCATLLSATNAFDRTSAARTLGEIGAASALPFLLEALYDVDSTVQNQVVMSIGELKLPSSMGVLLDVARKHPEVSDKVLSRALSASSVSGLAFLDNLHAVSSGPAAKSVFDISQLEPVPAVEDLPETSEEQSFEQLLIGLESTEQANRVEAAKALAHFRVKKSVVLLTEVARTDSDSYLKATAINSLGFIDHPSVFPAILLAMADESRMVRAAAARALGWLSLDRSEEYVRLLETADEQTLKDVADACIDARIVEHVIDRLASSNRYQAYEAFALLRLLVKAQRSVLILDALASHPDLNVGLSLIHLLAMTAESELLAQLEQLAERTEIRDELKAALRECRNKSELLKTKPEARLETEETAQDRGSEKSGHEAESKSTSLNPVETEIPNEIESTSGPRDGNVSDVQIDNRIDSVWKDKASALRARSEAASELLDRLESRSTGERAAALNDLAQLGGDDAFDLISRSFDDESPDVRNAAARALYGFNTDRTASFTRALHDGSPDRRRRIGASLSASGLASDAIANLNAESGEKVYDALSLLFLMAKAGEVQPLVRAIENYPNNEIRLAVVNLLALTGQTEIVPMLKRLAARGSQSSDVKAALMEAIYRINSQGRETASE